MHVTSRTFIKLPPTSDEPESQQHRGINASLPPKDQMTPSDVPDITDGVFHRTRSASSNLRCAPPNVRQTRSKSRPFEPNVRQTRQTRSKSHPGTRPEANPSVNLGSRSPGFTQKRKLHCLNVGHVIKLIVTLIDSSLILK